MMDNFGITQFDGYQATTEPARVKAVIGRDRFVTCAAVGDEVEVVLDRTPFYGEMGGQVGDRGRLGSDRVEVEITDVTHPLKGLFVHLGRVTRGVLEPEDEIVAEVDAERRDAIRRNHTATHLIHLALREVLGEHAKQAGSLVDPGHLRFDFTHYAQLTPEELREMEGGSIAWCSPISPYARTSPPTITPAPSTPWPSSGRSTRSRCGWWRWTR